MITNPSGRPRWTLHGEGPATWMSTATMALVLMGVGMSIAAQNWAVLPWKALLLLALWEARYWRNRASEGEAAQGVAEGRRG